MFHREASQCQQRGYVRCYIDHHSSITAHAFLAVLKKPLHTSIAVEMDEFDDIEVAEKLHIIINVRDFRAILQHANWTSSELNAVYSRPGRPMKISYSGDGIICDFILMTVDEKSTGAAQKRGKTQTTARPVARPASNSASNRPASEANNTAGRASPSQPQQQAQNPQAQMPPPRRPNAPRSSQFDIRAPLKQPSSTFKSDSLFLPQPDEDEQWEPVNPDDDEEGGENARLEWDASNEPVSHIETTKYALYPFADKWYRHQPCESATISTIRKIIRRTSHRTTCPQLWSQHREFRMCASLVFLQTSRFDIGTTCWDVDCVNML